MNRINKKFRRNRMKKLLVGLLLVSSVLSFGAQRVPIEKVVANGDLLYIQGEQKFTGEFERKDPRTGKINMVGSVKNGELHGTSYSYDENGKVTEEITFKKGMKEGASKTYYPSGAVSAKLNYKNDRYEGLQKYYYENGKLQAEIEMSKGQLDGVTKMYDENGKLKEETIYKNGKKVK